MSVTTQPEIGSSIDAGGIRTNYHESGAGDPLLLIHGSGPGVTAWANWRLNLPVFSQQFRVVAPDMYGFGYTERPSAPIRDKAIWVKHLVDFLDAKGLERVSLVGNSFGGAIALAMMIDHPDRVSRAVLMGSGGGTGKITEALDRLWAYEPSVEAMREAMGYLAWDKSRLTDELIKSRYEASARPDQHKPYAMTFGEAPRQRHLDMLSSPDAKIAGIQHEVLLLHGKSDQVIPVEQSLALHRLIPNSDLHLFGNCGHWVQIERAESFTRLVIEFIRHGLKA